MPVSGLSTCQRQSLSRQHEEFSGVRVTPSLYTRVEDVDAFVEETERLLA